MQIEEKLVVLSQLKAKEDKLEADLKSIKSEIETAQAEIIDEFESRQIKSMKLDGIGLFSIRVSSYPKTYDAELLRNWMAKNGLPWDLVTALHAKKLQSFYNERLELGEPLPDGVENFTKTSIVLKGGA